MKMETIAVMLCWAVLIAAILGIAPELLDKWLAVFVKYNLIQL